MAISKTSRSEPKTYREVIVAALAEQPKVCPQCGDDSDLAPTFDGDIWACGCGYVWEVKP